MRNLPLVKRLAQSLHSQADQETDPDRQAMLQAQAKRFQWLEQLASKLNGGKPQPTPAPAGPPPEMLE